MRWLVVLDSLEGLNPKTDTSLALIRQGRANGIEVDTAAIEKLYFDQKASVVAENVDGKSNRNTLSSYDIIFMRKEPPYDMAFHYATQLLSLSETLVVNDPASLRDYNEKLIALPFKQYMPPTLVSSDNEAILGFLEKHNGGVIKALDSFQGKSVERITSGDLQAVTRYTDNGKTAVMVQEFLDAVYDGDKRILMLGKEYMGGSLRRPLTGYHANFANSEALPATLTSREKRILEEVGPWLVKQGIHFVGLDFIGETLTEINITCPTGVMQVSELEGRNLAQEMVDYFVALCGSQKG